MKSEIKNVQLREFLNDGDLVCAVKMKRDDGTEFFYYKTFEIQPWLKTNGFAHIEKLGKILIDASISKVKHYWTCSKKEIDKDLEYA